MFNKEKTWLYGEENKMKRKVLTLVTVSAMAMSTATAMAATPVETTQTITVNGTAVDFEAYNIDGYNYFTLEDMSKAVEFTYEATEEVATEETATETVESPSNGTVPVSISNSVIPNEYISLLSSE